MIITDPDVGLGMSFSPDSKKFYVSTINKVYQYNLDTTNVSASLDVVALNDGFYSPYPPLQSDFFLMTL